MFSIRELEPLPGDVWCSPNAISNSGRVVGSSLRTTPQYRTRAVEWASANQGLTLVPQDLQGLLPGAAKSEAFDISPSGQIVGSWDDGAVTTAFRITLGAPHDLPRTAPGDFFNEASGTNAQGDVCGSSFPHLGNGFFRAVHWPAAGAPVWLAEDTSDPEYPNWDSWASGINSHGDIVGRAGGASTAQFRPCAWYQGSGLTVLPSLGSPGENGGAATALNDARVVVGHSSTDEGTQPTIWEPGKEPRNLLPPQSGSPLTLVSREGWATDINNKGVVVGAYRISFSSGNRAFLWQHGTWQDLNDLIDPASGWTLRIATAVNDKGQIAGVGDYDDPVDSSRSFRNHGFLLTPIGRSRGIRSLEHLVSWIIFGVRGDQPGVVVPPGGGPTPVPPWVGAELRVPRELRELAAAFATYKSAEAIANESARQQVQRITLALLREEVSKLLRSWLEISEADRPDRPT